MRVDRYILAMVIYIGVWHTMQQSNKHLYFYLPTHYSQNLDRILTYMFRRIGPISLAAT